MSRPRAVRSPLGRGLATLAVVLAVALTACLPAEPTPSSAASPTPDPSAPVPKPTNWPTGVIEAAIALGAADGDFAKVGADLQSAVEAGDVEALLVVVGDVIAFLEGNQRNVPELQEYPATRELGDALAPAYATMLEGATTIRAGLLAGDASRVESGFATFVEGTIAYSNLRQAVNETAVRALFMKRQLVR